MPFSVSADVLHERRAQRLGLRRWPSPREREIARPRQLSKRAAHQRAWKSHRTVHDAESDAQLHETNDDLPTLRRGRAIDLNTMRGEGGVERCALRPSLGRQDEVGAMEEGEGRNRVVVP